MNLLGMYPVGYDLKITDEGDLKIRLFPRVPPERGFGYGISIIERSGLKSIQGKMIEAD